MTPGEWARYRVVLCQAIPQRVGDLANWPPVYCTELAGHGGDHTCHCAGDVDFCWPHLAVE